MCLWILIHSIFSACCVLSSKICAVEVELDLSGYVYCALDVEQRSGSACDVRRRTENGERDSRNAHSRHCDSTRLWIVDGLLVLRMIIYKMNHD